MLIGIFSFLAFLMFGILLYGIRKNILTDNQVFGLFTTGTLFWFVGALAHLVINQGMPPSVAFSIVGLLIVFCVFMVVAAAVALLYLRIKLFRENKS
jgi:hypothetical protein